MYGDDGLSSRLSTAFMADFRANALSGYVTYDHAKHENMNK